MPTTAERNALLFLAAVAVTGGGVRVAGTARFQREVSSAERLSGGASAVGASDRALADQIAAIDSARAARSSRTVRARPRAGPKRAESSLDGEVPRISSRNALPRQPVTVDVNRATQAELEQLPRVGPALAGRIISWREQHGPFRSVEDLRHVRGIGPATVALLAAAVTF